MTEHTASRPITGIAAISYCAVFAAIIAVLAQISIPLPGGVPLTLQTFGIMLAGIVLGAKKGCLSVIIYILLGLVGLPVFAGFKGGAASVFGPTGGFIISFWAVSLCSGIGYFLAKRAYANTNNKALLYVLTLAGILVGAVLNYIVGIVWFSSITGNTMTAALQMCVLPFIVTDLIKVILALFIGPVLNRALAKNGLI